MTTQIIMTSFLNVLNMYLFFRKSQRQSMSRGGAERDGDMESEAGSELSSQNLMWGLNSQTVRSSPEQKSDTQLTEPPRHPPDDFVLNEKRFTCSYKCNVISLYKVWI